MNVFEWLQIEVQSQHFVIYGNEKGIVYVAAGPESRVEAEKWLDRRCKGAMFRERDTDRILFFVEELKAYVAGALRTFNSPIDLIGTEFERRVWSELVQIPYAQTRSYQDIANAIGCPRAVRAVARAIGANPVLLVVPCHRVIGKDGQLRGFRAGVTLKRALIELESVVGTE